MRLYKFATGRVVGTPIGQVQLKVVKAPNILLVLYLVIFSKTSNILKINLY